MTDAMVPVMHPIERALLALDEAVALLITSRKPTRFAEMQRLSQLAHQLALLRTTRVEDAEAGLGLMDNNVGYNMAAGPLRIPRFNNGADLNRELLMLAQKFMEQKPDADSRLREVEELTRLIDLRTSLKQNQEPLPEEIPRRIEHLIKRIGEPAHAPEPRPNPVVPADDVRGHQAPGPGEHDGDRMGEPLANGARGADLPR